LSPEEKEFTIFCVVCGKSVNSRNKRYCSYKCVGEARRLRRLAKENTGVKTCSDCKQVKPLSEFKKRKHLAAKRGGEYCQSSCLRCLKQQTKLARLKDKYNLTMADVSVLLAYQQNCCGICKKELKAENRMPDVDHDHKTGYLRGMLCWLCNKALGLFRDDVDIMANAVKYLHNPPAPIALGSPHFVRIGRMTNKREKKNVN
jgi:hypothetical protein